MYRDAVHPHGLAIAEISLKLSQDFNEELNLPSDFRDPNGQTNPYLLLYFILQEKKINVVTALRECCDAIYPILGVEAIQEDCLAALKHKTPTVKSETASFLARGFATCPPVLQTNKKVIFL